MRNNVTKKTFARKLVRALGSVSKEDVFNEARAIEMLQSHGTSENIVKVLGHGWLPEWMCYYIDMELCQLTLEDYLEGRESTSDPYLAPDNPRLFGSILSRRGIWNTLDIMEQISAGIEFVHARKQVHRDLKPRNAECKTWKICDFGLTSPGTSIGLKSTSDRAGTASYRGPELLRGEFNNKTDIFAMGCMLFELATNGKKAFANDISVHEHYASPVPIDITHNIDSQLRPRVRGFIQVMLAKDGSTRPSARVLRKRFSQSRAVSVGYACTQRRQFSTAIAAIETALEEANEPSALKSPGDFDNALSSYPEAIAAYEPGIQAGFNDACVFEDLGIALKENGDHSAAIERLKRAMKKCSAYEHLWAQLCHCSINENQDNESIRSYQRANFSSSREFNRRIRRQTDPQYNAMRLKQNRNSQQRHRNKQHKRQQVTWHSRREQADKMFRGAEEASVANYTSVTNVNWSGERTWRSGGDLDRPSLMEFTLDPGRGVLDALWTDQGMVRSGCPQLGILEEATKAEEKMKRKRGKKRVKSSEKANETEDLDGLDRKIFDCIEVAVSQS